MAFSKAARVMISRGKIFFSRRLRIAAPTDAHSCSFSGYSAGKDEDPVRVIPMASAALAIVFAVYICHWHTQYHVCIMDICAFTHPTACTGSWTSVAYSVVSFPFSFLGLTGLKILSVRLECRDKV